MFSEFSGYLTYIGVSVLAISGLWMIHECFFAQGFAIEGIALISLGIYRRIRHIYYRGGNLKNPHSLSEEGMMRFG